MARYRLEGRLETGELAELYKAVRHDGVPVVIKLFHQKTSDPAYARQLAETARLLNPLSHEGILHYLEMGTFQKRLALVREYVDGYSLGQGLQRLATKEVLLAPSVALHIIVSLLEALQKGHEAGCIHGAITPGNILLSRDGRASISDFGALRALQASPSLQSFLGKGRGSYRAPEVARGEEVTVESDLYSLGAIAYELLTLRELSPGKGMSVRREAVPPPSRVDRRINSRLDPVIMRAVDLVPGRRFRSSTEMITALRNFLSATGGMPGRSDVQKFVSELFPNEVKGDVLGPVPFQGEFELKEVSGTELPELDAERSMVLQPRPAFSGEHGFDESLLEQSDPRSETIEASPAFSPPPSDSIAPPKDEPNFDDGTSPGGAGPLEQGWDAPAAASAPKGPKLRPQGVASSQGATGAPSALKGRVRVVEDFEPLPSISQEVREEEAAEAAAVAAAAAAKKAPKPEKPKVASTPPPPTVVFTDPGTSGPRKLDTVERNLRDRADRKQKYVLAALAIAVVGAISFGYAIWRFQSKQRGDTNGPLRLVDSSQVKLEDPSKLKPPPVVPEPKVDVDAADLKPRPETKIVPVQEKVAEKKPASDHAFLTIQSNVPAYVFVDGVKLKSRTPIKGYPVKPGSRSIVIQAVSTGEKKKFTLQFAKGQQRKVVETFERSTGRR